MCDGWRYFALPAAPISSSVEMIIFFFFSFCRCHLSCIALNVGRYDLCVLAVTFRISHLRCKRIIERARGDRNESVQPIQYIIRKDIVENTVEQRGMCLNRLRVCVPKSASVCLISRHGINIK